MFGDLKEVLAELKNIAALMRQMIDLLREIKMHLAQGKARR